MLNTQELANYLTEQLNTIGAARTEPYAFNIIAELREEGDGDQVEGILRTTSVEFSPVNGYTEGHYVFALGFVLTSQKSNKRILQVNDIIGELVRNIQGTPVQFENGKGIVTLTTGVPEVYEIRHGAGESVPLSITVRVTYTENAVTSADKHWLLDGVEIPFLHESVTVEQDGMQRKVYTEKYTKTILTGHTKYYNFRIPYESEVYKSLQQEIMQTPDLRHTLTYYDGDAFTQENPFTADVVIFRSANASSDKPESSWFDVTFTDVYDSIGKALQYELALIDFPFDMNGEDTRYFASQESQQTYFEQKAAASSAPFVEIDAPTLDNLMITRQVYKNSADGMSQFDYVSKNYAIVKVTTASATKYFYYFVENCMIGSDGQVIVDLKMDTVQTYFFDPSVTFSDCMIERAHLNRFVDAGNGNVKFVSDPASKIFNSEEGLNFPKRMVKRTKLDLSFVGSSNQSANSWLNENVAYWVYIFIDRTKSYEIGILDPDDPGNSSANLFVGNVYPIGFNGQTGVICYPIYKNADNNTTDIDELTNNVIKINVSSQVSSDTRKNIQIVPHQSARSSFELANNDTSYYYTVKLSILPPFDSLDPSVNVDDNNNLIINCNNDIPGYNIATSNQVTVIRTTYNNNGMRFALFCLAVQSRDYIAARYMLSQNNDRQKSDITTPQAPNPEFNPKLNGQNFKELMVTAANGETFTYDIQKLAEPAISIKYSEPIVPEITRYYMRVSGGTGLYEEGTDENYMGLVGSADNGLAFTNDQYSAFIANNKNFFMQSNLKIGANLAGGVLGAAGKAVYGAILGAAGGPVGIVAGAAIGSVSGVVSSAVSAGISFIDRSLTVDNMKNAPDQMKNANGNVVLNLFVTDLGLYVEEYSALDGDLKTANDFMDLYGFTFSSVANVRDYANIRKYHNYIKAQLQNVDGNLSNAARTDLRNRFASGVRFWNGDTISYQYENYENWLEE